MEEYVIYIMYINTYTSGIYSFTLRVQMRQIELANCTNRRRILTTNVTLGYRASFQSHSMLCSLVINQFANCTRVLYPNYLWHANVCMQHPM